MLFEKEKGKRKIINMFNDFQVVTSMFNRNVT